MSPPRSGKNSNLLLERLKNRDVLSAQVKTVYHGREFEVESREKSIEDQRKALDPFFNQYDDKGQPTSRFDLLGQKLDTTNTLTQSNLDNQKLLRRAVGDIQANLSFSAPGQILSVAEQLDLLRKSIDAQAGLRGTALAVPAGAEDLSAGLLSGLPKEPEPSVRDKAKEKEENAIKVAEAKAKEKQLYDSLTDTKAVSLTGASGSPSFHRLTLSSYGEYVWGTKGRAVYVADKEQYFKGRLIVYDNADEGKTTPLVDEPLNRGLINLLRSNEYSLEKDLNYKQADLDKYREIMLKLPELSGGFSDKHGALFGDIHGPWPKTGTDPKDKGKGKTGKASDPPEATREIRSSGLKSTTKTKMGKGSPVLKITANAINDRIKLLEGTIQAGNTSRAVKNELSNLLDYQLASGMIGPRIHKQKVLRIFGAL